MKKRYFLLTIIGCGMLFTSHAQEVINTDISVYELVSKSKSKSKAFNFFLNTNAAFNLNTLDGKIGQSGFKFNDLRLEATGDIGKRIYYRYRQRLNRPNNPQAIDNMPNSIDYAAVGYRFTKKFSMFAGKQSTVYGGFEFDENPIEIIQYSDMIWNMSNYMVGITADYQFNKNQQVMFQVLNSRNGSFTDMYGTLFEQLEHNNLSLAYTLNWNAGFWDNMLKLRWSATLLNETKKNNMYYVALGQQLNFGKLSIDADFMLSFEDIDRKRIMTDVLSDGFTARNTKYLSVVPKVTYSFCKRFKVFVKGMYETASVFKSYENISAGDYRTAWGYMGCLEYYPTSTDLHFFASYVGRSYNYTDIAKQNFGSKNYTTQAFSFGLIYKLRMY